MIRLNLVLALLFTSSVSYGETGLITCQEKKMYLRDICSSQKLIDNTARFSECANGYSYDISTQKIEVDSDFVTTEIQCKMVEIRMKDGIETRTAYFDEANKKVVVYQHDNGLANAYVYGHTGYYHITKFASGDSIYNFHTFEN